MISTRHETLRIVVSLILTALLAHSALAVDYYLSQVGDDSANGTSPETAWQSIERANRAKLKPGDRLRLKAGGRFTGMLTIDVSGTPEQPIVTEAYGEGGRPLIDGNGEEAAIQLRNSSHITLHGLELMNREGRYGVRITTQNTSAVGGILIEDLDIHDIYQAAWTAGVDPGHDQKKYFGGINVQVERGDEPSWFDGITLRNNILHDLGTCGISVGSSYVLHERMRARRNRAAHPIRNVLIERNVFRNIARDGAIIRQCDGAVIQYNDVSKTGQVSISNGIWFWDCQNSTIRYNLGYECGVQGKVDGGPFSIDYYCQDCRIEYNYSHDNEGPGFMAFGNRQTGKGSVIRGNVSYNDATVESNSGFAAASFISTLSETIVEGNVIIAGPDTHVMLGYVNWEGVPQDILFRGNLFIGNGKAKVEANVTAAGRFQDNLFVSIPDLPGELGDQNSQAARDFLEAMAKAQHIMEAAGIKRNGVPLSRR